MDTIIDQQVATDEALVPHAKRLRIGRSNFLLLSDISSKESTLQLMYDATATVHHHSIRFKMDNKKHIVNLESFKEMLTICPRLPGQSFIEPPFEEEILAFLCFLGHSAAIKRLTDGLYHKRNVDFAYLMWEDFVYQVEHKDKKKTNEMYYPRDDHMFTTIKLVFRHQNMQQFGALLPIELTNEDIWNSNAYKEYYAVATGVVPPKPKASVRKTRSNKGTGTLLGVPDVPTDESEEKISWKSTNDEGDDDEGNVGDDDDGEEGDGDDDDEDDDGEEGNDDDDDYEDEGDDDKDDEEKVGDDEQASDEEEFIHPSLTTHAEEETKDEESFDPIPITPEDTDDEGNGKENLGINVGREEGHDEEEEEDELYREFNINQGKGMESIFETTSQMDVQTLTSVAPLPISAPTITLSTIATITTTQQAPTPPTTAPRTFLQDLPNFVAADLSEMELKKILIEKMEGNKEGKEPESASAPKEKATRSAGKSTKGSKSRQTSASGSSTADEPMQTTFEMEEPSHPEFETKLLAGPTYELMKGSCKSLVDLEFFLEEVYKATTDQLDWVNPEGQQYPHNLLKPLPLIPNDRGHRVIPFDHFINNDLEYLRGGASSHKYTTSVTKTKAADYRHINDGMLTDVRTALDDRLKGIRIKYLPQSIYKESDKDRATAMIQAIDKRLKTRRIMRSLERFVGGRLYEGDFRMLQRTI
nr:hypothetical protein [Tanacetum cinerariifolium]